MLDREIVERLEQALEDALARAMKSIRKLPGQPSAETLHLMAKAATTVYEASRHEAPGR